MIGITAQECLIILDRVALDRDGIGLLGGHLLDPAHLAHQGRRRGFRLLEEHEGGLPEIGRMPGDL